jgi:hypothetical protein
MRRMGTVNDVGLVSIYGICSNCGEQKMMQYCPVIDAYLLGTIIMALY